MSNEINFMSEISKYAFYSKYSQYNEEKKRRETFEECVDRSKNMMLKRYYHLNSEDKSRIDWSFDMVKKLKVMPSMRSLQFGGKAIEAHNARIYNCAVRHIDSLRSFSESFYKLLCGCGVTFGLNHFIERLPDLVDSNDKNGTVLSYVVDDSIEGWADSLEALLMCYFKNTPFSGRKIVFDYSKIRPKGAKLKTGGGKAPGHEGLKLSHIRTKELLDTIIEKHGQTRLKTINAYDILMYAADAVLSGGIRRAACAVIFAEDDEDMLNAKINFKIQRYRQFEFDEETEKYNGFVWYNDKRYEVSLTEYEYSEILKKQREVSWIHVEPQRARSNNSILLLRNELTMKKLKTVIDRTLAWGEPGFVFADHRDVLLNPCFEVGFLPVTEDGITGSQFCVSGDTKLITKKGIETIAKAVGKNIEVWNGEEWSNAVPQKTQSNVEVYRVYFSDGSYLDSSSNHRFLIKEKNKKKYEEKTTLEIIDLLSKNKKLLVPRPNIIEKDYKGKKEVDAYDYGFFKGDGHLVNNKSRCNICIYNEKDASLGLNIRKITSIMKNVYGTEYFEATFDNLNADLGIKLKNSDLEEIFSWDRESILNFIAGWADADGSQASKGIRIYGNEESIRQGQLLLTKLGIISSVNLMSKKGTETNLDIRKNDVWYLQITKTDEIPCRRLVCNNSNNAKYKGKNLFVRSVIKLEGLHDVYCLEEKSLHQCTFNNVLTKQCNLTTINGAKIESLEDWLECAEAATIIGTLQAGFTDFKYLSKTAKHLTDEEALLGVSLTGWFDNPEILFNYKNQYVVSKYCEKVNIDWSEKLNINRASRITLVKPEGTSSLVLESSSGIHPHHDKRYFRRIQANKIDNIYQQFKQYNPHATEESVWSIGKTDDVVTFPLTISNKAIVKNDISAIEHLTYIKNTQENWVKSSSSNNKKPVSHNISCTVEVDIHEWEEVIAFLFENRDLLTAVALLPKLGDKMYKQAPVQRVLDEDDEKLFKYLEDNWKPVDYIFEESEDNTKISDTVACGGGACELVF